MLPVDQQIDFSKYIQGGDQVMTQKQTFKEGGIPVIEGSPEKLMMDSIRKTATKGSIHLMKSKREFKESFKTDPMDESFNMRSEVGDSPTKQPTQ